MRRRSGLLQGSVRPVPGRTCVGVYENSDSGVSVDGLEAAPRDFIGRFEGKSLGKMVVKRR
jgi:hypothetical protein